MFYFKVDRVPKNIHGLKLLVDIEGYFKVELEGCILFEEDNMPILEVAQAIYRWQNSEQSKFHYFSMEVEEGPILSFKPSSKEQYEITSVWGNGRKLSVKKSELLKSCNSFIAALTLELKNHNIKVEKLFQNSE